MTKDEAKDCVRMVNKLFTPPISDETAKLLVGDFQSFKKSSVDEAIREHRRTREFLAIPGLLEGCRCQERGDQMQARQFIPDQTFAAIYRNQRPDLRDANDYEVIIRIHRSWWKTAARWDDETNSRAGSESLIRQIDSSCVNVLIAAGMEPEAAGRWSAYTYLHDHECQNWLEEIRQMIPTAQAKQNAEAAPIFS